MLTFRFEWIDLSWGLGGQLIEIVLCVVTTTTMHMWTFSQSCFRSCSAPAKWSRLMGLVSEVSSCHVDLFLIIIINRFSFQSWFTSFLLGLVDKVHPVLSSSLNSGCHVVLVIIGRWRLQLFCGHFSLPLERKIVFNKFWEKHLFHQNLTDLIPYQANDKIQWSLV